MRSGGGVVGVFAKFKDEPFSATTAAEYCRACEVTPERAPASTRTRQALSGSASLQSRSQAGGSWRERRLLPGSRR